MPAVPPAFASSPHASRSRAPQVLGTLALWLGGVILAVAFMERTLPLPGFWYVNRVLWLFIGLVLLPIGWMLHKLPRPERQYWRPSRPGQRFHEILLFTKPGCHLCEEAEAILGEYRSWLPEVRLVDISADPELQRRYGTLIPVVHCDGKLRFKGRVNEVLLRRLIEGTPPLS